MKKNGSKIKDKMIGWQTALVVQEYSWEVHKNKERQSNVTVRTNHKWEFWVTLNNQHKL